MSRFKKLDGGKRKKKKGKKTPYKDDWISKEALAHIGDETLFIDKRAASARRNRELAKASNIEDRNRMVLSFQTTDGREVILKGTDQNLDSIYIVLKRVDRKYAISSSTLVAGKY